MLSTFGPSSRLPASIDGPDSGPNAGERYAPDDLPLGCMTIETIGQQLRAGLEQLVAIPDRTRHVRNKQFRQPGADSSD
jgi:hypothetical protein